jgi:hypothetical protein
MKVMKKIIGFLLVWFFVTSCSFWDKSQENAPSITNNSTGEIVENTGSQTATEIPQAPNDTTRDKDDVIGINDSEDVNKQNSQDEDDLVQETIQDIESLFSEIEDNVE